MSIPVPFNPIPCSLCTAGKPFHTTAAPLAVRSHAAAQPRSVSPPAHSSTRAHFGASNGCSAVGEPHRPGGLTSTHQSPVARAVACWQRGAAGGDQPRAASDADADGCDRSGGCQETASSSSGAAQPTRLRAGDVMLLRHRSLPGCAVSPSQTWWGRKLRRHPAAFPSLHPSLGAASRC